MYLPVLLAGGTAATFDLTTMMSDAVSTVQGQIFSTLGLVVPGLIAVTSAVVGVRFGLKWLRSLGKG